MEREPSSLRWDSNVWLWVLRDSDHWQIALKIADPSSRQRGRHKTKIKAIVRQKKGKRKIWSWAPKGCPTPRHTDWPTVSRAVTSTSITRCHIPEDSFITASWKLLNLTSQICTIIHFSVIHRRRLDSAPSSGKSLFSWAQSIDLVLISVNHNFRFYINHFSIRIFYGHISTSSPTTCSSTGT
jgi:hypothetical protein